METVCYPSIDRYMRTRFLTTLDGHGAVVRSIKLKNNPGAIRAYFRTLKREHQATVETSTGWFWMNDLLQAEGVRCCYLGA